VPIKERIDREKQVTYRINMLTGQIRNLITKHHTDPLIL